MLFTYIAVLKFGKAQVKSVEEHFKITMSVRTHERTRGRKVASSSPVATEDPPYKWVRGSVSTFWCGVVGKGSLAQVSSSSLDRGSKLEVRPNSPSIAFSQRSSSPRLIEDETFNNSDNINNLINYEDGHEARFFESG
ncbi:hypothetical protein TNCV_253181 [Trichonephila clavipes]|nr:hypothetical protein TNCV_253181 [Trichonephila clavipes]